MTRGRLYAIVAALIKDPIRDMINPAIERIWLCVVEGRATTAAAGVVGVVAEAGGGGGVVWLLNLGLMRQRSKGCVWKVGKRRESQSITLWMLWRQKVISWIPDASIAAIKHRGINDPEAEILRELSSCLGDL